MEEISRDKMKPIQNFFMVEFLPNERKMVYIPIIARNVENVNSDFSTILVFLPKS